MLVHNCNVVNKTLVSELVGTHNLTMSKSAFRKFVAAVKTNGITEPIKYVEHNGIKYIVDGHHRAAAARQLGIKSVPTQKVTLPYKGYRSINDLLWD